MKYDVLSKQSNVTLRNSLDLLYFLNRKIDGVCAQGVIALMTLDSCLVGMQILLCSFSLVHKSDTKYILSLGKSKADRGGSPVNYLVYGVFLPVSALVCHVILL